MLAPLDRRMVDRVAARRRYRQPGGFRRQEENVIVDGLTVSTHDIVFASANGSPGNKGTEKKPVTLDAAVVQPGTSNAIIVALGGTPFPRGQALSLANARR